MIRMDSQIKQVQQIGTAILCEVIAICKRHGINYYLVGGTGLGAVRHKGFIPWDDDVDILMTIKSRERFIEAARTELPAHLAVDAAFSLNRQCPYIPDITRIYDKRYRMINPAGHTMNLAVDIHTLVGMPKHRFARKIFYDKVALLRTLTRMSRPEIIEHNYGRNRSWIRRGIIHIVQSVPFDKLLDYPNRMRALERALRRYPIEEAEFAMLYPSPYGKKEIMPKAYYGDGIDGEFEGMCVRLPSGYHELLTQIYGDYITPPSGMSEQTKHVAQMEEFGEDGVWHAFGERIAEAPESIKT